MKKSINKLNLKELIALSSLFNLPINVKCDVMKDNLKALSEHEIKTKIDCNVNSDDGKSVVSS